MADLIRFFRKADKAVARELVRELRGLGELVAVRARANARAQGLVRSGNLVGSIRPAFARNTVSVRINAHRGGFPYPAVHEYGGRVRGETVGPRASLNPALTDSRADIIAAFEEMLDRIIT